MAAPDLADEARRAPSSPPLVRLFFGADLGLVRDRAQRAVTQRVTDMNDPFSLIRLAGEDVARDPGRLLDEAMTLSFGERTIWVDTRSSSTVPGLERVFEQRPPDVQIIIEAGDLKRDSALRKLCEQRRDADVIACRPATRDHLAAVLSKRFGDRLTKDALTLLLAALPPDFLSQQAEISKLEDYARDLDNIGAAEIEAVIVAAEEATPFQAMDAALSQDLGRLAKAWTAASALGVDANAIVSVALRGLLPSRPHSARSLKGLDILFAAQARVRQEPRLANATALRAFWTLARVSGSRRNSSEGGSE
jgi:DNA polymerase-3 subunit delta